MNNDLKQQDCNYCGDPMFDDILKDLLTLTVTNQNENEETSDKSSTKPIPPPRLTTPTSSGRKSS